MRSRFLRRPPAELDAGPSLTRPLSTTSAPFLGVTMPRQLPYLSMPARCACGAKQHGQHAFPADGELFAVLSWSRCMLLAARRDRFRPATAPDDTYYRRVLARLTRRVLLPGARVAVRVAEDVLEAVAIITCVFLLPLALYLSGGAA